MRLIFFILLFISSLCFSQTLSDRARISVITCGPGQQAVYTAFGHSAFRVEDPVNRIDQVYNYGAFDFRQKNFYLNFARGQNYYRLASYSFRDFEYEYIYYNRYIHQQVLNLTAGQQQKLFDFLQWNAKPENQYYLYDYFYDNCATRIRDVVQHVFGDSVKFDGSYIDTDYSIRELTDLYLQSQPWGDLGIDICLGLPMDKKATPYEYMFLPDYIESAFAHASIKKGEQTIPLVERTFSVFEPGNNQKTSNGLLHPFNVFTGLFIIAALFSFRDFKRGKLTMAFDAVFFAVLGAIGLLLFLLWVATDHKAAANNLNLLWALPTHIIAVIAFIRQPKWLEKYFLVTVIINAGLLLTWPILPQKLHYALVPIMLISALRAMTQYFIRRRARLL
jgi:hypothetical protein